jgi:sugar/nucleoside kinase (ribokinase family)
VKNNARIGSQIALAFHSRKYSTSRPVIVGGTVLDITATLENGKYQKDADLQLNFDLATSLPGRLTQTLGGVGRNVAEACFRSGTTNVALISAVGEDIIGQSIIQEIKSWEMVFAMY